MTDIGSVSRAPGFFERYYICRDTTGIMNKGFNISIKLNEKVSDILLSNALRKVVLSCPYLTVNAFRQSKEEQETRQIQSVIKFQSDRPGTNKSSDSLTDIEGDAKADGKNYRLQPIKKILYTDVVFKNKIAVFDESYLEQLSEIRLPVDQDRPMWYLSDTTEEVSGEQYLTFACNHVVFDGRSAISFFEDLVKALDEESCKPSSEVAGVLFDISIDHIASLQGPSEKITDLYDTPTSFTVLNVLAHSVPKFVSKFVSSYLVPSSPNLYQFPLFDVASFDGNNVSQFRLIRFDQAEVKTVLGNCKKLGSTLTPTMAAILYKCIEESFKPHLGDFSQNCELMICGRRFYPEKKKDLRYGLFVSACTPYIQPSSSVCKAAQDLSENLIKAMKDRSTFHGAGLLRLVNIWDYLKSFATKGEDRNTFEISNLGRVDISSEKWHATDLVFSQGVTFAHITLSVISTPEGGMNIAISFHKKLSDFEEDGILSIDKCIEKFRAGLLGKDSVPHSA